MVEIHSIKVFPVKRDKMLTRSKKDFSVIFFSFDFLYSLKIFLHSMTPNIKNRHLWPRQSFLKTNSDTFYDPRMAKDSDGKPAIHGKSHSRLNTGLFSRRLYCLRFQAFIWYTPKSSLFSTTQMIVLSRVFQVFCNSTWDAYLCMAAQALWLVACCQKHIGPFILQPFF